MANAEKWQWEIEGHIKCITLREVYLRESRKTYSFCLFLWVLVLWLCFPLTSLGEGIEKLEKVQTAYTWNDLPLEKLGKALQYKSLFFLPSIWGWQFQINFITYVEASFHMGFLGSLHHSLKHLLSLDSLKAWIFGFWDIF